MPCIPIGFNYEFIEYFGASFGAILVESNIVTGVAAVKSDSAL